MDFDSFGSSGFDAGSWGDPGYGSFGLSGIDSGSGSTGTNYGSWDGASADWGSSYGGWDQGWSDPGYGSFGLDGIDSGSTGTDYGSWGGASPSWDTNYGSWSSTQMFDDGSTFTNYPDGSYGSTLAPSRNVSPTIQSFHDQGWGVKDFDDGRTRVLGPGNVRFTGNVDPATGGFDVLPGGVYAPDQGGTSRGAQGYAQSFTRDAASKLDFEDNAPYKSWGDLWGGVGSWFGW